MPWKETDPRRERTPCSAADRSHVSARTARGERCGRRRTTGYPWGRRETEPGRAGRQAHRHGGPRQLLPALARRRPDLALPAPSPAGELCPREG